MFKVRDLTRSYVGSLAVRVKLGELEPGTLTWYKVQLAKLDAAAGDYPAAELRAHHLVAVEFTYHFVRALRALYRWACDEDVGLVPKDPFKKLRPPPCGQRNRILSRVEMVRLYLASSRRMRRLLFVLARTIARPGEIRELIWGDIQWDRRIVTLVKFKGKKRRRDGVKVRTIPLDRPTWRMLRNVWERRGRPGPDQPVWLDRYDGAWSANGVRCAMRKARAKAGLDPKGAERVVCYTMRHTGATEATRTGMPMQLLARVMGHSKTTTTDRYQHLAGDDLVAGIDLMSARRGQRAG